FTQVCEGVQHAHQKGIIHRDLKPSNVLVRDQDGKPVPKIIDFGIAKATAQRLTERTLFTELGQLIGTPEYMSPEQAEMTRQDIDTRTDVYSLGVLLYELLVGELPFDAETLRSDGFQEFRRKVIEDEPPTPSSRVTTASEGGAVVARSRRTDGPSLVRALRGDLDWITMKALEKDRTRRYGSASELAADIRRYLANEPVLASPPSNVYRLRKFMRRHRAGVAFASVIGLLVVGLIVTLGVSSLRIRRAGEVAKRERDRANEAAHLASQEAEAAREVSDFLVDL
ncbi:MAG: protein kinase, partial [Gammaproteobacteria bacterium]|nr:protein kinase [Gammaproteobacteria bacterium]